MPSVTQLPPGPEREQYRAPDTIVNQLDAGTGAPVGASVGSGLGGGVGGAFAAVQTVAEMVLVMLESTLNEPTVLTRLVLPAMVVSSAESMPDPTPIAKIVIPLARADAAAEAGDEDAWPSVITIRILCAPCRAPLKTEFCTYVIPAAVWVEPPD